MSRYIYLACDADECLATFQTALSSPDLAGAEAARSGWSTGRDDWGRADFCPAHAVLGDDR